MKQIRYAKNHLRHAFKPLRHAMKPVRHAVRPLRQYAIAGLAVIAAICACPSFTVAQTPTLIQGAELNRVVPPGFYFQGQSAPTQRRNSAAARLDDKRFVVVGMVDTSGYSADIRAKYEGFLITDSPITINGSDLAVGAYGFGFSNDGKFNILDLGGNEILSVATTKDSSLRRPRPLMMSKSTDGLRLYSGRDYAVIAFK